MMTDLPPLDVSNLGWPGAEFHLEQYLGLWAIEETFFSQQWEIVRRMNLAAHARRSSPRTSANVSSPDAYGIEVIEIRGTMTKQGSSLSDAGSTVRIRQAVRDARNDPAVKGVLFVIDSPGGTVAGTGDLADEMSALSDAKPTVTFAEDLMASAGLYAGLQSRKVFANVDNAIIGGMGVFIGLYDLSGMAAKEGIKPVVIKTGELKGAGFPGSEITDAQKEMWQGLADESFKQFSAAVQRRRKLSSEQMKEVARAGVYPAKQAVDLGLIDGIRSYDGAMAELRAMIPNSSSTVAPKQEYFTVSHTTVQTISTPAAVQTPPAVSAIAAWNSAVAGLEESGLTRSQSISQLTQRRPDLHQAYLAEVNGRPVPSFNAVDTSNVAANNWRTSVAAAIASGLSHDAAIRHVVATQPEIHKAYIAEVNAGRRAS